MSLRYGIQISALKPSRQSCIHRRKAAGAGWASLPQFTGAGVESKQQTLWNRHNWNTYRREGFTLQCNHNPQGHRENKQTNSIQKGINPMAFLLWDSGANQWAIVSLWFYFIAQIFCTRSESRFVLAAVIFFFLKHLFVSNFKRTFRLFATSVMLQNINQWSTESHFQVKHVIRPPNKILCSFKSLNAC